MRVFASMHMDHGWDQKPRQGESVLGLGFAVARGSLVRVDPPVLLANFS